MRSIIIALFLASLLATASSQQTKATEVPMSLTVAAYAEINGHCDEKLCQVVVSVHDVGLLITYYRGGSHPMLIFTEVLCDTALAIYGSRNLSDRVSFGELKPNIKISVDKYDADLEIGQDHAMLWHIIYLRRLIEVSTMIEYGVLSPSPLMLAEHECRPAHVDLNSPPRR